jgi:ribonuclease P protein component
MLSKRFRLSRQDFIITKSHGKSYSTPHLSAVVYRPTASDPQPSRFSVVLSAKYHKSAVVRNRLRRQIYDILRCCPHLPKSHIIFFPKPNMLNLTSDQITLALNSFLSKIST